MTPSDEASQLAAYCPHLHGSAPKDPNTAYCPQWLDVIPAFNPNNPIVLCWNYTEGGSSAALSCPQGEGLNPFAFATKFCNPDGSWAVHPLHNRSFVKVLPCFKEEIKDPYVIYLYWSGYSVSIVALVISLIIFRAFRQLQCDRLTLHKHLFSCYLLNAAVWIIFYVILGHTKAMAQNWTSCKILHLIVSYFSVATYMWMFCEGLYLVVILVITFIQNTKAVLTACMVVGWVVPLLLTIFYGSVRWSIENPKDCWSSYSDFHYILHVPIIISLTLNIAFVVIIICVLIMKLRSPVSPDQQQGRKAAKAIVILVPLLGIQYIFMLVKAETGVMMKAHEYTVAVFVSFQGFLVAVLFCFLNQEVHNVVGQAINRRRYNTCDHTESTAMSRRISRVNNDRSVSRLDRQDLHATADAGKSLKAPACA